MCFEQRRKELQANSPQWGDHPTTLSVKSRNHYMAREESFSEPAVYYDQLASSLNAIMNSSNMGELQPIEMPPKLAISTKGWKLVDILKHSRNFHPVPRVSASLSPKDLREKIESYDGDSEGVPLVIEGWHNRSQWPDQMFTVDNFTQSSMDGNITVRNVHNWTDKEIPLDAFITKCRETSKFAKAEETERLYGKDAQCPKEWNEWLHEGIIPKSLLPRGPTDVFRYRPNAVETLMCYLGIGDTFTPCHKDLCASSGQNLMCYTEPGASSFWFMTASSTAIEVSRYFQELGQELDHETHVLTIDELAKAPFKVYITEQKIGDLVLVPPRSCHQVVNYGGLTIKTSWSRMTLEGLATAYYHELPLYRRVCRPETYQVKNTIYHSLVKITEELRDLDQKKGTSRGKSLSARRAKLAQSLNTLLELFDSILLDEYAPNHGRNSTLPPSSGVQGEIENHVSCDFCGADIFQSFFECRKCVSDDQSEGGYAVCPGCYTEGRSCKCITMKPMQLHRFEKFLEDREKALAVLKVRNEGENKSNTFQPTATLFNGAKSGAFRAACILLNLRKMGKIEGRKCYPGGAHQGEDNDTLPCKKCHHRKCFAHILSDQRVHSIDALILHNADGSHQTYHTNHVGNKQYFEGALPEFLTSQKLGRRPVSKVQLVHAAMSYVRCKPINPAFMRQGWYDAITYITSASTGEDGTRGLAMHDESPLTSCPTTPRMSPKIPDIVISNPPGPLNKPPPRQFMECVQISSARPFMSVRANPNKVVPTTVSAEPLPTALPKQPAGPSSRKRKRPVESRKESEKARSSRKVTSQEATGHASTNTDNVNVQRHSKGGNRITRAAQDGINAEADKNLDTPAFETSLTGAINEAGRQNGGQTSDINDPCDHDSHARSSKRVRTANTDCRTSAPRRGTSTPRSTNTSRRSTSIARSTSTPGVTSNMGVVPTRFRKRPTHAGVGQSQINAANTSLPDVGVDDTSLLREEILTLREQKDQLQKQLAEKNASMQTTSSDSLQGSSGHNNSNASMGNIAENTLLKEELSTVQVLQERVARLEQHISQERVARLEQHVSEKDAPVEAPLSDAHLAILTSFLSTITSRPSDDDHSAKVYCQPPAARQDHQYREPYYDASAPYLDARYDTSSLGYHPFHAEHGPQFDRPVIYERPSLYGDPDTNHRPKGEFHETVYGNQPWGKRKAMNPPSRGRVYHNNTKKHFPHGPRHSPVEIEFHHGREGSSRGPLPGKGPPLAPRGPAQGIRSRKAYNPASHLEPSKNLSPSERPNYRRPQSYARPTPARVECGRSILPVTPEAVDDNVPEFSTPQSSHTRVRATPTRQQDSMGDTRCLTPMDPQAWEDDYDQDGQEKDNNAHCQFREPKYQPPPLQNKSPRASREPSYNELSYNPWT